MSNTLFSSMEDPRLVRIRSLHNEYEDLCRAKLSDDSIEIPLTMNLVEKDIIEIALTIKDERAITEDWMRSIKHRSWARRDIKKKWGKAIYDLLGRGIYMGGRFENMISSRRAVLLPSFVNSLYYPKHKDLQDLWDNLKSIMAYMVGESCPSYYKYWGKVFGDKSENMRYRQYARVDMVDPSKLKINKIIAI